MSFPVGASQSSSPPVPDDRLCRAKQVFSTGSLFAATLDHLNRRSTLALFHALAHQLDEHDRQLTSAGSPATESRQLRAELLALLSLLRQTVEQQGSEVAAIKRELAELQELGLKARSGLEDRLAAIVSLQLERELKPMRARLAEPQSGRQRSGWRAWLALALLALLALLLAAGFFAIGYKCGGPQRGPLACQGLRGPSTPDCGPPGRGPVQPAGREAA